MIRVFCAEIGLFDKNLIFDEILEQVKEQRRSKVLRCNNKQEKRRVLLAGWLLRKAIESVGLDYEKVEISRTEKGKPYLVSYPEYYISLSHSGIYAICVIADAPVGVDVEGQERRLLLSDNTERLETVARKCLTTEEYEHFCTVDETRRRDFFLRMWTRKEAVSKAEGLGLGMDFSKISEPEECFYTCSLAGEYYVSVYSANGIGEDIEICMMS